MTPAILDLPPTAATSSLFPRRRVIIGLGIAAALHVGLALAWWLTPPLRLKVGYSPDRWVQVLSLPKPELAPTPAAPPVPAKPIASTATGTAADESKVPAPAPKKIHPFKAAAHAQPLPASAPDTNK